MWYLTEIPEILQAWIVYTTVHGMIFCGLIAAVYYSVRKWMPPTFIALLWFTVILRMLIPTAPTSEISLFSWFDFSPFSHDVSEEPLPVATGSSQLQVSISHEVSSSSDIIVINSDRVLYQSVQSDWFDLASCYLFAIWMLGAGVFSLLLCRSWWVCRQFLRNASAIEDQRLLRILERSCRLMHLRRSVRLVSSSDVQTPALMGIWRPVILWPETGMPSSSRELRMLFCHELAHLKRQDIAMRWVIALTGILQWMNPVYWWAKQKVCEYQEIACDRAVILRLNENQRTSYGSLMIDLAAKIQKPNHWIQPLTPVLGVEFGRRNGILLRRLKMLRRNQGSVSYVGYALAGGLLLVALVVGFTDSFADTQVEIPQERPVIEFAKNVSREKLPSELPSGMSPKLVAVTYDIEQTLKKLSEDDNSSIEQVRKMLKVELIIFAGLSEPQQDKKPIDLGATKATFLSPEAGDVSPGPYGSVLALKSDKVKSKSKKSLPFEQRPLEHGAKLALYENQLIASATPDQHRRIKKLLDCWSQFGMKQITFAVRVLECSQETYNQVISSGGSLLASSVVNNADTLPEENRVNQAQNSIHAQRTTSQRLGAQLYQYTESELKHLIQMAQSDVRSNLMFAPKVTLFSGQNATVSDTTWRPFVAGLEVDPETNAITPKIEVYEEGMIMNFETKMVAEGKFHLQLHIEQDSIGQVDTFDMKLPDGSPIAVQIPVTTKTEFATQAVCGKKTHLVIAGLPGKDANKHTIVTVSSEILDLDE